MSEVEVIPELKQIIGAMLYAAKEPVSLSQMRHVFEQTAEQYGAFTKDFAAVTDDLLEAALADLDRTLKEQAVGLHVREVAHGYRLANDANCGPWLRVLLEKGKASRLSRPALETLAIIAYRQPVIRSEIEAVRGVAVDQMIRNLLDLQLIRIVGRSDLPGRPWMFGTTQKFLEHFGIKSVNDLPGTDELRRLEAEQLKRKTEQQAELPIPEDTEAASLSEQEEPEVQPVGEGADDHASEQAYNEDETEETESDLEETEDDEVCDEEDDFDDDDEFEDDDDEDEDEEER